MLAVGMLRNKAGVHSFEIPMPEIRQPDEVLIRIKEVGLDGTDFNIVRFFNSRILLKDVMK
jgi:threonine dehydrogenase-like Zn-dependent dehydrogenase